MQKGFSLVELSIVLVILGLLTGGILAGQSLIRAAELRASISQYQRLSAAIYSFRERYMTLPGDMANATQFWGAADNGDGVGTDCYSVVSTGKATCNGDGNGVVLGKTDNAATLYEASEEFRLWQHLANAGLIEGSYAGVTDSASNAYAPTGGVNAPTSKISGGGAVRYAPATTGQYYPELTKKINVLILSKSLSLLPEENYSVDIKLDDGKPANGLVQSPLPTLPWATDCTTSTDPAIATYNLSLKEKRCLFSASVF